MSQDLKQRSYISHKYEGLEWSQNDNKKLAFILVEELYVNEATVKTECQRFILVIAHFLVFKFCNEHLVTC